MPVCGPTNAIPSCAATPSVGFGSDNRGFGGALGLGGLGSIGSGYGGTVSAARLRVLQGVRPDHVVQFPPNGLIFRPTPCNVTLPGAILSPNPDGHGIGGYAPCVDWNYGQGFGYGVFRYGHLGYGGFRYRGFGYGKGGL